MQLRTQGNRIEPSKFGSKPRFSNGGSMRLNITAMSMASGLLWGASILIIAAANLIWPGYGQAFLQLCGSIFPGYRPGTGLCSVVSWWSYVLGCCVMGGGFSRCLVLRFSACRCD